MVQNWSANSNSTDHTSKQIHETERAVILQSVNEASAFVIYNDLTISSCMHVTQDKALACQTAQRLTFRPKHLTVI